MSFSLKGFLISHFFKNMSDHKDDYQSSKLYCVFFQIKLKLDYTFIYYAIGLSLKTSNRNEYSPLLLVRLPLEHKTQKPFIC